MARLDKSTLRFIDRLYKDLYLSEDVLKHSSGNRTDKFNNLEEFFNMLENMHERAKIKESRKEILKRMYHEKYVIKPEDIPESHYEMQEQMALERGFGHVTISDRAKQYLQKEVVENQERSLDVWLDYFLSEDSDNYPFWAKYWAFQGMVKLGKYNKEEGKFYPRTKSTTAPFADLNREALAISIDYLLKSLNKESIDDNYLELLVQTGSFAKIYTYVLKKILTNNENIIKRNKGKWVKYKKNSDPRKLVDSLKGYNTGWCTAGEATAREQLKFGDFYVYYTLDENNEYKVPRIAIRMDQENIAEIRGIGPGQSLENEMELVVEEKIKDFPNKELYFKRVSDMKILTTIYNKTLNNEELTIDEIRFLYEIDNEIIGFGYQKDPRIREIIKKRDEHKDLSLVFNFKPTEIALDESEITKETKLFFSDTFLYNDDLPTIPDYIWAKDVSCSENSTEIVFKKFVSGDITIDVAEHYDKIVLPEYVGGKVEIRDVETIGELEVNGKICKDLNIEELVSAGKIHITGDVLGYIDLSGLKEFNEVVLPEVAHGPIYLTSITTLNGITLPKVYESNLSLGPIEDPKEIDLPDKIGGSLTVRVKSAKDLKLPDDIGGCLYIYDLKSGKDLKLPKHIGQDIVIRDIETGDGLELPEVVNGTCALNGLRTTKGIKFPKRVLGDFVIGCLNGDNAFLEEDVIELPEEVGNDVRLYGIGKVGILILPENIGTHKDVFAGSIYLNNLRECNRIIFPKNKIDSIVLNSIKDISTIDFPEELEGNLTLNSLEDATGAKFPRKLEGLWLGRLKSANGVVFPEIMLGNLYLDGLETMEGYTPPPHIEGEIVLKSDIKSSRVCL